MREKDILPVVLTSLVRLCLAWFFRTSRGAWNTSAGLESFRFSGRWRNENARVGDKSARGLSTDIDKHKWSLDSSALRAGQAFVCVTAVWTSPHGPLQGCLHVRRWELVWPLWLETHQQTKHTKTAGHHYMLQHLQVAAITFVSLLNSQQSKD